jgi:NAD-dependent dihydropyrimidine dehydrogenase PreA subunit
MVTIETLTGKIVIDDLRCKSCPQAPCVGACPNGVLQCTASGVGPAHPAEEIKRRLCVECLACEIICHLRGEEGLSIDLPLPRATA